MNDKEVALELTKMYFENCYSNSVKGYYSVYQEMLEFIQKEKEETKIGKIKLLLDRFKRGTPHSSCEMLKVISEIDEIVRGDR